MTDAQNVRSSTLGDSCVREIPHLLSKTELRDLSKIDSVKFTAAVLIEVVTVAAAIAISVALHNPIVYVLAVIVIGTRINAFGALMHDAAHYRAYSNRMLNDMFMSYTFRPTQKIRASVQLNVANLLDANRVLYLVNSTNGTLRYAQWFNSPRKLTITTRLAY